MKNINDEYRWLTHNHRDERSDNFKTIGLTPYMWMLEMDQKEFYISGGLSRPAEFRIDDFEEMEKRFEEVKTLNHDFIVEGTYGFLVSDKHKSFFMSLKQKDIVLHPAIIIGEREEKDDAIFEGYWLIPKPHRPLSWVNLEKSKYRMQNDNSLELNYLRSVELKQSLKEIPLEERLYFNIAHMYEDSSKTYISEFLVHNSIAEYIAQNDRTEQTLLLTTEEIHEDPGSLYN